MVSDPGSPGLQNRGKRQPLQGRGTFQTSVSPPFIGHSCRTDDYLRLAYAPLAVCGRTKDVLVLPLYPIRPEWKAEKNARMVLD